MVPIVSLAAWVGAAQVMFGTWNPAMAMLQRTAPGGLADMGRGLLGLTADVQYGLVPAAPMMAAAPWAAVAFTRAFPLLGSATIVAAAGVMAMSSLWMWWGGDSAPARFLTVILPALALWLALLWSQASVGARRVLVLALAVTAGMTVLHATVDGGARAYTFADGRGVVFDAWSRSVDVGLALPSLFRAGESTGLALALTLVWLVAGGVAGWIVGRLPATRGEGAATGLGGLVLLVAAGMAAEAGWRVAGRAPWTPAAASLAVVQNVSARPMVGFGVDSLRVRSAGHIIGGLQLRTPESISETRPTLLYIPNVPAGVYDIHASAPGASDVAVRLELGRESWPFASWSSTQTSRPLRLHAAVHSVRILGDAPAGVTVWLQPRELALRPPAGEARRVTRYGDVVVYSMDDDTYAEPTGLWTGADRVTRLLVASASDSPAVDVAFEAGPAPVELRLSATPARSETITLAPGARRIVPLASDPVSGVVDLRVEVGGGFPAAALGNASDSRRLGVWLAFSASDRR